MRVLRALAAVLLWLVASLLMIISLLLCVTLVLLPLGVLLLFLSIALYAKAVRLLLPRSKDIRRDLRKRLPVPDLGRALDRAVDVTSERAERGLRTARRRLSKRRPWWRLRLPTGRG